MNYLNECGDVSLANLIKKIENLFSILNNHYYDGVLVKPMFTIIPKGRKRCLAWCSNKRVWEKNSAVYAEEEDGYFEVNICAEDLALEFEKLAEVLLHELAHLYNAMNGVKDVSRNGTYHNMEFKKVAELHGLMVEKDSTNGYSNTSLTEISKEFINSLPAFKFDYTRICKSSQGKSKHSMIRLTCPICSNIARVTSQKTKIKCGICDTAMI